MVAVVNTHVNTRARVRPDGVPGGVRSGVRGGATPGRGVPVGRVVARRRPARPVSAVPLRRASACAVRPGAGSVGWLLLVGLIALLVVLGLAWAGSASAAAAPVPTATVLVQVHPGQTIWDVAEQVAPDSPRTAVVARIRQLNALSDGPVYPGQLLEVPDAVGAGR